MYNFRFTIFGKSHCKDLQQVIGVCATHKIKCIAYTPNDFIYMQSLTQARRQGATARKLNKRSKSIGTKGSEIGLIKAITAILPSLSSHQLLYTLQMVGEMAETFKSDRSDTCPLCGWSTYTDRTNHQHCPDCGWSSL